jgi:hypothetical protein
MHRPFSLLSCSFRGGRQDVAATKMLQKTGTKGMPLEFMRQATGGTMKKLLMLLLILCCWVGSLSTADAQPDLQWKPLHLRSGATIEYPSAIFLSRHTKEDGTVVYSRSDGDASFSLFDKPRPSTIPLVRLARQPANIPVTYRRITSNFFVLSGVRRGTIFYRRCNVSGSGIRLACFDIAYPQTERGQWDKIVTRISRSLRAGKE